MSKKLNWIEDELNTLKDSGLYNQIRTLSSPQGSWLVVDGHRVLNFCSNNYLGLANQPRLLKAAREAIEKYGVGPAAVRTIAGTMDLHKKLEQRMATFKGVSSSITFQSGFCANLATIPALVGKEDAIFSDELNHASIIDGCRLSRAKIIRYNHCDPNDLRQKLDEHRSSFPRPRELCRVVTRYSAPWPPSSSRCTRARTGRSAESRCECPRRKRNSRGPWSAHSLSTGTRSAWSATLR